MHILPNNMYSYVFKSIHFSLSSCLLDMSGGLLVKVPIQPKSLQSHGMDQKENLASRCKPYLAILRLALK